MPIWTDIYPTDTISQWRDEWKSALLVNSRGKKGKGSPYSIAEHRVPQLIPVLGSQLAGDVSHKPGSRLPLLSTRPAVTLAGCYQFCCLVNRGTMGVNSLPKTVTRQHRGCDLNPGPSAPESSMLTTWLPSHCPDGSTLIFGATSISL